jgi:hypothetical protein
MAGRGRPSIMNDRVITTVSIERNDLEELHRRKIEISDMFREWVQKILNETDTPLDKLQREAEDLKDSIRNQTSRLETIEDEIQKLKPEFTQKTKRQDKKYVFKRFKHKIKPINKPTLGDEFHHMHLKIGGEKSQSIGIYIPKELHRSIHHQGTTGKGMEEINKASLLWLCEQSEI